MNYEEVKAAWNAKADEHNDWTVLGADEMVEFAISIEREECAKLCEENCAGYKYGSTNNGPCLTEFPKESGGRHDGMTYAAAIRSKA